MPSQRQLSQRQPSQRQQQTKQELINMGMTYLFGGMVVLMSFPAVRFFA